MTERPSSKPNTPIDLPIDAALDEIAARALESRALVLTAAPGAGKTTRVPPALLRALDAEKPGSAREVWLLEPRRLAARAAAQRIAEENGWTLGEEVGYQVRFENRIGQRTRLHAITEGLLARRLASDPLLKNVGCVILDEFHERSWHVDLALGLLYELQQTSRPDLVIVVMSATLDSASVAEFLGDAPIIDVPGRAYPVETEWSAQPQLVQTGPEFSGRAAGLLRALIEGGKPRVGDVLAFLPGAGEIGAVARLLDAVARAHGFDVLPLHGGLALDEQSRAIRRGPRPKIVLATNVAETSVTVDGVGTVVDSGLARVMSHEAYGFPRLELERISRFSAVQRAGRAGRQGPGRCYRLWTQFDDRAMAESDVPEILRMDLSEALLALASQGIVKPEGFSWIETPPSDQILAAQAKLTALGALDPATGALTPEGRALLRLPLEPRLAKLALEGARRGSLALASGLAAVLSEKDVLRDARDAKRAISGESDPLARLWSLEGALEDRGAGAEVDRGVAARVRRAREQIMGAARAAVPSAPSPKAFNEEDEAKRLLLSAHADLLARRRTAKGGAASADAARLVGGRGAKISPLSACERSELFVCVRATERERGGRTELIIDWASAVEKEWVLAQFPERISKRRWAEWDDETGQALAYTAACYLDLPLEEPKPNRASAEDALPLLTRAILDKWDPLLARDDDAARLLARLRFARATLPELAWPELNDEFKRAVAERLAHGETRLSAVEKKSWSEAIADAWPWETRAQLEREAPARFEAPSGSRLPIEYPEGQAPYVEVRVQEVFGLRATPRLAQGRTALQMRLLGPNYRPVQVTQDLASFWKNGYLEARKELRARYPKHSWPEDPDTAKPEAKGRPRK